MIDTVEAFFYGLYMNPELVESLGFVPMSVEKAQLNSYALDLCGAAKIVPKENSVVWGNIIKLSKVDLVAMYSFEATQNYSPEIIHVKDSKGNYKSVHCYNLPESNDEPFNREYHQKLLNLLKDLDFPGDYIVSFEVMYKNQT